MTRDDHKFRLGQVLVVCAPSGTGKSTLISMLREEFPDFGFSISYTTRAPRGAEQDGREYHFVSRDTFVAMRSRGAFCEWAEVHGNFYGTATKPVEEMLGAGQDVLFDIDVQGAKQLKKTFYKGTFVFLLPPSREELVRRLKGRGTDSEESIAKRLANASGELSQAEWFDSWVVNDDLDEAYAELRAVYLAGRCKPSLRPGILENIMDTWKQDG
ncbi:MAG: guanylate kinase [Pseudodesulfovibrio sp.]|uniref:Guanylate kinase n=1 Tax=Pseudodesulfovibrio indicus TaxID=1716143 RepID=A0A126QRH7_9BACT|nr:guanylate kinase [Pseudodesulfovibrio indicus]AMK12317.1 guanylate kinase [Pseudodesulfovibrio indicus]TDT90598.1 guanylate kinase [Pseudodesulfovibrio indicus]